MYDASDDHIIGNQTLRRGVAGNNESFSAPDKPSFILTDSSPFSSHGIPNIKTGQGQSQNGEFEQIAALDNTWTMKQQGYYSDGEGEPKTKPARQQYIERLGRHIHSYNPSQQRASQASAHLLRSFNQEYSSSDTKNLHTQLNARGEPMTTLQNGLTVTEYRKVVRKYSIAKNRRRLLPHGSVRKAVYDFCGKTFGVGFIFMPFVFRTCGLLWAFGILLAAGLTNVFSTNLLVTCLRMARTKTYEELAFYCFGKTGEKCITLTTFFYLSGVSISYILALSNWAEVVMNQILDIDQDMSDDTTWSYTGSRYYCLYTAVFLLPFPYLKCQRLNSFYYINIRNLFMFVISLVITISSVSHIIKNPPKFGPEDDKLNLSAADWSKVFLAIPIVMFAMNSQVNVFSIYTELRRRRELKWGKVVKIVTIVCYFFYTIIGCFGYLWWGRHTNPNLIVHFCRDKISSFWYMLFGCVWVLFSIISFSYTMRSARFSFEMFFVPRKKYSKCRKFLLTFLIQFCSAAVGFLQPRVIEIVALTGALPGAVISCILPATFYIRLKYWPPSGQNELHKEPLLRLWNYSPHSSFHSPIDSLGKPESFGKPESVGKPDAIKSKSAPIQKTRRCTMHPKEEKSCLDPGEHGHLVCVCCLLVFGILIFVVSTTGTIMQVVNPDLLKNLL